MVGGDLNKFWWKSEDEAVFEGHDHGESATDFLYSRLISPFWNLQGGIQYANEWEGGGYHDRFSGVVAIQGLVPYKFEVDASLYVSEDADVTLDFEAEVDLRITQRLVLQPLVMLSAAFQDIPERGLASGLTDTHLDLRLRYEIKRELAPYLGVRYRALLGGTEDIAEAAGESASETYYLASLRFAF
jgi:copper resistance protein B